MAGILAFLKQINGISLPIGGISWNPSKSEKRIIRDLIISLSDRRIIFNNHGRLNKQASILSLSKIRDEITAAMKQLEDDSSILIYLQTVREKVAEFQTHIEHSTEFDNNGNLVMTTELAAALREFRQRLNMNFSFIKGHDIAQIEYTDILNLD